MRIALDAMGGDHAPEPIVAGAVQAVLADPELTVVLVGDQARLQASLESTSLDIPSRKLVLDRIEINHAAQIIGMDESPVEGLRKKTDSSISRCWLLLAERQVEAVVSAGNTGAMVAAAGMILKRFLPNVRRPGIATIMPTARGPSLLLDVGANISPKPSHLLQYGVMGSLFAQHILKCESPRIGLLNVGAEAGKGHDLARKTHELFLSSPLKGSFVGNIEGRDVHHGFANVIITDGFVGNVVLKLCEGVFEFVMKMVTHEMLTTLGSEKDLAKKAIHALVDRYDYSVFGGAPLLGIDGICIVCHGSSGDRAIRNALKVAASYARQRLNDRIVTDLAALPGLAEDS